MYVANSNVSPSEVASCTYCDTRLKTGLPKRVEPGVGVSTRDGEVARSDVHVSAIYYKIFTRHEGSPAQSVLRDSSSTVHFKVCPPAQRSLEP